MIHEAFLHGNLRGPPQGHPPRKLSSFLSSAPPVQQKQPPRNKRPHHTQTPTRWAPRVLCLCHFPKCIFHLIWIWGGVLEHLGERHEVQRIYFPVTFNVSIPKVGKKWEGDIIDIFYKAHHFGDPFTVNFQQTPPQKTNGGHPRNWGGHIPWRFGDDPNLEIHHFPGCQPVNCRGMYSNLLQGGHVLIMNGVKKL